MRKRSSEKAQELRRSLVLRDRRLLQFMRDRPRELVEWFVRFAQRDLSAASTTELRDTHWRLARTALSGVAAEFSQRKLLLRDNDAPNPTYVFSRAAVLAAQAQVRAFLGEIAGDGRYRCQAAHGEYRFYRDGERVEMNCESRNLPTAVVLGFAKVVNRAGAQRLRLCPFKIGDDTLCGVIFFARHANKDYCTRRHSAAAAYSTWYDKRRRKTNRKARRQKRPAARRGNP